MARSLGQTDQNSESSLAVTTKFDETSPTGYYNLRFDLLAQGYDDDEKDKDWQTRSCLDSIVSSQSSVEFARAQGASW